MVSCLAHILRFFPTHELALSISHNGKPSDHWTEEAGLQEIDADVLQFGGSRESTEKVVKRRVCIAHEDGGRVQVG
jgi:hypothetical protein